MRIRAARRISSTATAAWDPPPAGSFLAGPAVNRRRAYRLSWFRRVSVLIGYSGIPAVPAALRRAPDDPGDAFYDQPDKMEALQPPGGRVRSHADQLGLRLHPRHEPGLDYL